MRSVVFSRPAADLSATQVVDVAEPEPGPGEVAVSVRAAGVNFIDVMARRGDPGYAASWPFTPGMEVAGTVRALGPGVDGPPVGTPVAAYAGSGGLAEVAVVRAEVLASIPAGVPFEQAATAPGTLTTATLLLRHVEPGQSLLVHSAGGGVGRAIAQVARLKGAGLLLGTVGSDRRVEAAEKAGYDVVLVRGDGLADAVRDRTGGRGVDQVFDPQGTAWIGTDLDLVAPGGRITLFGNAGGAPLDALPTGRLFAGNAAIGAFSLRGLAARAPEQIGTALAPVLDCLRDGTLTVPVTVLDGLDRAAEAQQALSEGQGEGKYVIEL